MTSFAEASMDGQDRRDLSQKMSAESWVAGVDWARGTCAMRIRSEHDGRYGELEVL